MSLDNSHTGTFSSSCAWRQRPEILGPSRRAFPVQRQPVLPQPCGAGSLPSSIPRCWMERAYRSPFPHSGVYHLRHALDPAGHPVRPLICGVEVGYRLSTRVSRHPITLRAAGEYRRTETVCVWLAYTNLPPLPAADNREVGYAVGELATCALLAGCTGQARILRGVKPRTAQCPASCFMENGAAGDRTYRPFVDLRTLFLLLFPSRAQAFRFNPGMPKHSETSSSRHPQDAAT